MKLYNIFVKENKGEIEDIAAIREDFSFWAFVFSGAWLLYKKMWREFIVFVAIFLVIASGFLSEFNANFLNLVVTILIGLNANYLLGKNLERRSYKLAGVVLSDDEETAKIKFLEGSNPIITT